MLLLIYTKVYNIHNAEVAESPVLVAKYCPLAANKNNEEQIRPHRFDDDRSGIDAYTETIL